MTSILVRVFGKRLPENLLIPGRSYQLGRVRFRFLDYRQHLVVVRELKPRESARLHLIVFRRIQIRQIGFGHEADVIALKELRNLAGGSGCWRLLARKIVDHVPGTDFAVMSSDSHQPFAGVARPSYDVHAFPQFAGLRIEYLVWRARACAIWIRD